MRSTKPPESDTPLGRRTLFVTTSYVDIELWGLYLLMLMLVNSLHVCGVTFLLANTHCTLDMTLHYLSPERALRTVGLPTRTL